MEREVCTWQWMSPATVRSRGADVCGLRVLQKRMALIFKPSRCVMTSGQRRTKQWLLRFERITPQYIEPLMGWTTGDDPLEQVELRFGSLAQALHYANHNGLNYRVLGFGEQRDATARDGARSIPSEHLQVRSSK